MVPGILTCVNVNHDVCDSRTSPSLPCCGGIAASKWGQPLTTKAICFLVPPSTPCIDWRVSQNKFPGANMTQNKVLLPFDILGESDLASCTSSPIHPLLSHLCWSVWHKKVGVTPYDCTLVFIESESIKTASAWVKHYSQRPLCQCCVPALRPGLPECEMKQVIHFPVRPTVAALSFIITVKQKADENNFHFYALGPIPPPPTKTNEDGIVVGSTKQNKSHVHLLSKLI